MNLGSLLVLQQAESRMDELEQELASLDAAGSQNKAVQEAAESLEKARVKKREAERVLKDLELRLASLEAEKKQAREKLYGGKVTNAKELSQLEKDVESLGKKREKLDEQVLEQMEKLDEAEKELSRKQGLLDEANSGAEENRAAGSRRREELLKMIEDARRRSEASAQSIESDLLSRYKEIKHRAGGVAVVRIHNNTCGGCYMQVPQSAVQRARAYELVLCGSCGRILVS